MISGDIVLVKFPFTNLEKEKKRPALLLKQISFSRSEQLNVIVMITSQIESPAIDGDVLLSEWKASGLLHQSRVRLAKMATIESTLIESKLGKLQPKDLQKVKKEFSKMFEFWID